MQAVLLEDGCEVVRAMEGVEVGVGEGEGGKGGSGDGVWDAAVSGIDSY